MKVGIWVQGNEVIEGVREQSDGKCVRISEGNYRSMEEIHSKECYKLYSSPDIIKKVKLSLYSLR